MDNNMREIARHELTDAEYQLAPREGALLEDTTVVPPEGACNVPVLFVHRYRYESTGGQWRETNCFSIIYGNIQYSGEQVSALAISLGYSEDNRPIDLFSYRSPNLTGTVEEVKLQFAQQIADFYEAISKCVPAI